MPQKSGLFHEKLLSPSQYMNTWLCSRGGDEAARLSSSDIILMSAVARKFLTVTALCLSIFALVSPQQWSQPCQPLLAFAWLSSFCLWLYRLCSCSLKYTEWSGFLYPGWNNLDADWSLQMMQILCFAVFLCWFFFSPVVFQCVVFLLLRINLLKGFGVLSVGLEGELELEEKTLLYLGMHHFQGAPFLSRIKWGLWCSMRTLLMLKSFQMCLSWSKTINTK